MNGYDEDWPWATNKVRIPYTPLPASASIPLVFTLFHVRLWTFAMTCAVMVVFLLLHLRRRNAMWLWRRMRSKMRSGIVYARPVWYRRRFNRLESFDALPNEVFHG